MFSFSTALLNPNTQKIALWGKLRGKNNVRFIWGDDGLQLELRSVLFCLVFALHDIHLKDEYRWPDHETKSPKSSVNIKLTTSIK